MGSAAAGHRGPGRGLRTIGRCVHSLCCRAMLPRAQGARLCRGPKGPGPGFVVDSARAAALVSVGRVVKIGRVLSCGWTGRGVGRVVMSRRRPKGPMGPRPAFANDSRTHGIARPNGWTGAGEAGRGATPVVCGVGIGGARGQKWTSARGLQSYALVLAPVSVAPVAVVPTIAPAGGCGKGAAAG